MSDSLPSIAVVDRSRCVSRGPCAATCPSDAIRIRPLTPEERAELTWTTRLKLSLGGSEQAVVDPEACVGCAACVMACPENALSMSALDG
jgi:ferredoxin